MVDPQQVERSLRSVRQAHDVLAAFHREIISLFQVVDDQLAEDGHGCKLTAFDAKNFVWTSTSSATRVQHWVPSYLGRLYYDEELDVPDGEPETLESRAAALVAIYVPEGDELAECWFGFGRPGEGTQYTDGWNFGRNGLWNYSGVDAPTQNVWAHGTFAENAKYGVDGVWRMRRTPLTTLTSEDAIREFVSMPLLQEWRSTLRT